MPINIHLIIKPTTKDKNTPANSHIFTVPRPMQDTYESMIYTQNDLPLLYV